MNKAVRAFGSKVGQPGRLDGAVDRHYDCSSARLQCQFALARAFALLGLSPAGT